MDVKTIARITYQCGNGMLALRTYELRQWRSGILPAGEEFAGKHISVQIDGGRTKIRGDLRPAAAVVEKTNEDGSPVEDAPGRSKKRPRQTFDAEWREPKLVTIFVHDEHGRMEKESQAVVDGTFLGPDAMAELVAMHLHRLGAAQAASITFVGDGAPWIWDRVPTIVRLAKLDGVPIHEVLDCCHAAHHISLALAALGQNERERMPLYREHRTLLRNGQWRRMVEELAGLAEIDPENEDVGTPIAYLRKHGEAGRLQYPTFRKLGLPLGSGAIESGIRRVINLRLKNNGMFWRKEHAEEMLQVRATGYFQTLGRAREGDAAIPSPGWSNRLEMGASGDEFQNLNAKHQRSCTSEKRGKLITQIGIAPSENCVPTRERGNEWKARSWLAVRRRRSVGELRSHAGGTGS